MTNPHNSSSSPVAGDQAHIGVLAAIAAFAFWGISPVYFKWLVMVPPAEVLAHRVVWTVVLMAVALVVMRRWGRVRLIVAAPMLLVTLAASSLLVSMNWGTYIWAITNDRMLETSLGYYINPLVNVLLGFLFLGERLGVAEKIAVALATIGVINLIVSYGDIPWVALFLAFSFAFYSLIRKKAPVDSLTGLFVETAFVVPMAAIFLLYLHLTGVGSFGFADFTTSGLLLLAGLVTAFPLVLFAYATKRLRLSTIGFIQYIGPTIQLLLAVFVYGETFTKAHWITFTCIWLGLLIYTVASVRRAARSR